MNDHLIPLPPVTDLKWGVMYSPMRSDDDACMPLSGAMCWRSEVYASSGFLAEAFQEDGAKIAEIRVGANPSKKYTNFSVDLNSMLLFQTHNNTLHSGRYYFTVQALGDNTTASDSEICRSALWTYVRPQLALPQVSGGWDGTDVSLFYTPDSFSDMSRQFLHTFYAKVMYQTESGVIRTFFSSTPENCTWDQTKAHISLEPLKVPSMLKPGARYCCHFCAVSKDITICQHGPWNSTPWKVLS